MKVRTRRYEQVTFEVEVDCGDLSPELTAQERHDTIVERMYTVIQNEYEIGTLIGAQMVSPPTYGPIVDGITTVTVAFRCAAS